jgi:hypothetical protein
MFQSLLIAIFRYDVYLDQILFRQVCFVVEVKKISILWLFNPIRCTKSSYFLFLISHRRRGRYEEEAVKAV